MTSTGPKAQPINYKLRKLFLELVFCLCLSFSSNQVNLEHNIKYKFSKFEMVLGIMKIICSILTDIIKKINKSTGI